MAPIKTFSKIVNILLASKKIRLFIKIKYEGFEEIDHCESMKTCVYNPVMHNNGRNTTVFISSDIIISCMMYDGQNKNYKPTSFDPK